MKPPEAAIITPVRMGLGALFTFAAYLKLENPQSFVDSIKAFKVFDLGTQSHLIVGAAFTIPWLEMLCGVLLLIGLWTRAAALALSVLLAAFTAAVISVLYRDLDVRCGCFGKYEWPCKGSIGACHVARNSILLLASLLITVRAAGPIALDHFRRKPKPVDSPNANA